MSIKLTDTQLLMLSAAAQRNDRYLVAAPNLKVAAAQKIASKLIGAGLVKEVRAKAGAPVWRRDDDAGLSYALRLAAAGVKAIAIDESAKPGHVDDDGDLRERRRAGALVIRRAFGSLILHRRERTGLRPGAHPLREAGRSWRRSSNCFNRIAARASPS